MTGKERMKKKEIEKKNKGDRKERQKYKEK